MKRTIGTTRRYARTSVEAFKHISPEYAYSGYKTEKKSWVRKFIICLQMFIVAALLGCCFFFLSRIMWS